MMGKIPNQTRQAATKSKLIPEMLARPPLGGLGPQWRADVADPRGSSQPSVDCVNSTPLSRRPFYDVRGSRAPTGL